ncbi:uncharacterized protein LOC143281124 [Babylonia areolata]|uniref:uncharacterized protein LOC143281124 n=1 Tax=Babylonia areolata TaxID=304850 RepID=UPI003FCF2358
MTLRTFEERKMKTSIFFTLLLIGVTLGFKSTLDSSVQPFKIRNTTDSADVYAEIPTPEPSSTLTDRTGDSEKDKSSTDTAHHDKDQMNEKLVQKTSEGLLSFPEAKNNSDKSETNNQKFTSENVTRYSKPNDLMASGGKPVEIDQTVSVNLTDNATVTEDPGKVYKTMAELLHSALAIAREIPHSTDVAVVKPELMTASYPTTESSISESYENLTSSEVTVFDKLTSDRASTMSPDSERHDVNITSYRSSFLPSHHGVPVRSEPFAAFGHKGGAESPGERKGKDVDQTPPADATVGHLTSHPHGEPKKKIFCYYSSSANARPDVGKFWPEHVDPFLCSHLIFAFADISEDGKSIKNNNWNDFGENGLYARTVRLKEKNPKLKVLLAVGGWKIGSKPFLPLIRSDDYHEFSNNVVNYLRTYGFDGLDMDWEFPATRGSKPEDKFRFTKLMKTLFETFAAEKKNGKDKLLLTLAAAASDFYAEKSYERREIHKYVDYVLLMAYNYHGSGWEMTTGHHAPILPHRKDPPGDQRELYLLWSIDYWLNKGVPKSKLIVGLPAFGMGWKLTDPAKHGIRESAEGGNTKGKYSGESGILAFYEICEKVIDDKWKVEWIMDQRVPYAHGQEDWIGFDSPDSTALKTKIILKMDLAGAFLWSLEMDDFRGHCGGPKFPILRTVYDLFSGATSPGVSASGALTVQKGHTSAKKSRGRPGISGAHGSGTSQQRSRGHGRSGHDSSVSSSGGHSISRGHGSSTKQGSRSGNRMSSSGKHSSTSRNSGSHGSNNHGWSPKSSSSDHVNRHSSWTDGAAEHDENEGGKHGNEYWGGSDEGTSHEDDTDEDDEDEDHGSDSDGSEWWKDESSMSHDSWDDYYQEPEEGSLDCSEYGLGIWGDEDSCQHFNLCVPAQSEGMRALRMKCPDGTKFDWELKVCNYAHEVDC